MRRSRTGLQRVAFGAKGKSSSNGRKPTGCKPVLRKALNFQGAALKRFRGFEQAVVLGQVIVPELGKAPAYERPGIPFQSEACHGGLAVAMDHGKFLRSARL